MLEGKKILFVCPEFHHYHISIREKLKKKGAEVYFIPTFRESLVRQLWKKFAGNTRADYYRKKFSELEGIHFDYFFQIRGEDIMPHILSKVVKQSDFSVMYQWDSVSNCNYLPLTSLFNKVYSFDRKDTMDFPGIKYLQLFHETHTKSVPFVNGDMKLDLLTVAGYTSWRYEQVNLFYHLSVKHRLRSVLMLYIPVKTFIKLWLKGARLNTKILTLRKISKKEYETLLQRTTAVLDIPSPAQTGLSIRTVESLASGKKLITTNKNICNESFFSKDLNYLLDDHVNEEEILSFIKTAFTSKLQLEELELGNWLDI
jgi:hypothetical protein